MRFLMKNGEVSPDPKEPALPAAPSIDAYIPPSHRQKLGRRAVEAAQQWDELEHELAHTKQELADANAHISVIEESNNILHEDIDRLRAVNERLVRENTVLHTRLQSVCDTLVNIMRPLTPIELVAADAKTAEAEEPVKEG